MNTKNSSRSNNERMDKNQGPLNSTNKNSSNSSSRSSSKSNDTKNSPRNSSRGMDQDSKNSRNK